MLGMSRLQQQMRLWYRPFSTFVCAETTISRITTFRISPTYITDMYMLSGFVSHFFELKAVMVARREDAEVSSLNLLLYTSHSPAFCLYYTAAVKCDDFWFAF